MNPIGSPTRQQELQIEVLVTFDYPATFLSTAPGEIDENGDVAGSYTDANGLQRGFVRHRNGQFSPPIVPPFDIGSFTAADDINDARTICGFFASPDDKMFHGYFLSGRIFTQFDIDGAGSTFVAGINDGGDFVGSFSNSSTISQAYADISGTITVFNVPGASYTAATSINERGEAVGNYRIGTETTNHGFLRDESGTLTFPIDFPGPLGSLGTVARGINGRDWVVGGYFDASNQEHGFLYRAPSNFVSFLYPDALSTRLSGINNAGLLCGSYVDSEGKRHGFIARLR